MDISAMDMKGADVIYFVVEGNNLKRIDSAMIEPLHSFGHSIVKMYLADDHTEMLNPEDEIPEGFIKKSEYGLVFFNVVKKGE